MLDNYETAAGLGAIILGAGYAAFQLEIIRLPLTDSCILKIRSEWERIKLKAKRRIFYMIRTI